MTRPLTKSEDVGARVEDIICGVAKTYEPDIIAPELLNISEATAQILQLIEEATADKLEELADNFIGQPRGLDTKIIIPLHTLTAVIKDLRGEK